MLSVGASSTLPASSPALLQREPTSSLGSARPAAACQGITIADPGVPNRSIIMSVAAWLDLNSLDNLSRTCRLIHQGLLQYRTMLLVSTLHCVNERLPVDPDEALRYRARAGNWHYMQDVGRAGHAGKSSRCARDLVAGCRRCGTVVCRVGWNPPSLPSPSANLFPELLLQAALLRRPPRPPPAPLRVVRLRPARLARQARARPGRRPGIHPPRGVHVRLGRRLAVPALRPVHPQQRL